MHWQAAIIVPTVLLTGAGNVDAEMLYPEQCCPRYCATFAEVTRIRHEGDLEYVDTLAFGKLTIPPALTRLESPDEFFHICAGFTDHDVHVKCLFVPPVM